MTQLLLLKHAKTNVFRNYLSKKCLRKHSNILYSKTWRKQQRKPHQNPSSVCEFILEQCLLIKFCVKFHHFLSLRDKYKNSLRSNILKWQTLIFTNTPLKRTGWVWSKCSHETQSYKVACDLVSKEVAHTFLTHQPSKIFLTHQFRDQFF